MIRVTRLTLATATACLFTSAALAQVPQPAPVPAPAPTPFVAPVPPIPPMAPVMPSTLALDLELARLKLTRPLVAPSDLGFDMKSLDAAMLAAQAGLQAGGQATEEAKRAQERALRDIAKDRERLRRDLTAGSGSFSYSRGTAALDAGRWAQARDAFADALKAGYRPDGSLYWQAYAQYKLADRAAALAGVRELLKAYPTSRWLKEARALEQEISGPAAAAGTATGADDELKLLALNSLANADAEQVVPMLDKILTGPNSPQLKKRALFVLAQSKSPKARDILVAAAKGSSNPDLQLEAVRYIGVVGGGQNIQLLSDIYTGTKDADVKRRILEAYMVAGQRDLVLQAAKGEPDVELRSQAVQFLGVLKASAELEKLYQAETNADIRRAVIEAYMVSGDYDRLLTIAKTDRDSSQRLHAIEMLGVIGRGKNAVPLNGLYTADGQTPEAKRAVINALFISGDAKSLIDIARKETDPVLRKDAVSRLAMMKSKEATDFMIEIINK